MNSNKNLEILAHGVSGCLAGCTAMTLTFPLDTIRTHVQINSKYATMSYLDLIKDLIDEKSGGPSRLYQGLGPVLTSLASSNFVYFYVNNYLKEHMGGVKNMSTMNILWLAFVAGCVNIVATNPFWVVTTRLRTQQRKKKEEGKKNKELNGMIDGFQKIAKHEGIGALWNGTIPSLILVSNPTINYVTYDLLKNFIEQYTGRKHLSGIEFFILGLLSKAVATFFTYPLQIAQSRIRNKQKDGKKVNTFSILMEIYEQEGIAGWFNGFGVKFLQTVITNAFHMLCYEKILEFILAIFVPKSKKKNIVALKE